MIELTWWQLILIAFLTSLVGGFAGMVLEAKKREFIERFGEKDERKEV